MRWPTGGNFELPTWFITVLSKLFLNEPPFYGSANIFETQDAMEWPTKKFGNTASVLAC
jgi:hypothetical protein